MCFIHFIHFNPFQSISSFPGNLWKKDLHPMAPRGAHKVSKSCAGHVPNLGDMLFWTSLWGKSRHVFMIFRMMSSLNLSNNSDSCIVIWAHIVIQHTKNSRQMDWIHQVPLTGQDSSRKASSRAFNIRCTRAEVKCSLKGVGANGEPGRNSINAAQTSEMLKWWSDVLYRSI